MKKFGYYLILVLGITVCYLIFTKLSLEKPIVNEYNFSQSARIGEYLLKLAIVSEPDDLAKGLSGHRPLATNEGLLFVFPREGRYGIWMKEMRFPIDVLWLDSTYTVVYIKENFLNESYPEIVEPPVNAKYVVETYSGTVLRAKLKIGDKLIFSD